MTSRHPRVDLIVEKLKKWSKNSNLVTSSGGAVEALDTDYILHQLNAGKDTIQYLVASTYQNAFGAFEKVTITSRLSEVPIPLTALNERQIIGVYWAATDDEKLYRKLEKKGIEQRLYSEGDPDFYTVNGTNIMLSPNPDNGVLKFHIQRKDDDLDVRRGKIASVTQNIAQTELTTIVLDSTDALMDTTNRAALETAEYVCVSDWAGDVKFQNAAVDHFDDQTGTLYIRSGIAYDDEIAVGDFVTVGLNTTTHSKLPRVFYRYYLEWARHSILRFDNSEEGVADLPMMQALQTSILESFADNDDELLIPLEGDFGGEWPL